MMNYVSGLLVGMMAAWPAGAAGISAAGPADGEPAAVAEYGRFVGEWRCRTYARIRDGSWQANEWESTWTWHWVLQGHAIQDVWEVPPEAPRGSSLGTNLRIYNPEAGAWRIAWTTTNTREFDLFEARAQGAELVMTGAIPARGQLPPHTARVTFHDIAADSFQWRYEASLQGGDGPWSEQARLSCRRAGG